jgi:hypothetical protein
MTLFTPSRSPTLHQFTAGPAARGPVVFVAILSLMAIFADSLGAQTIGLPTTDGSAFRNVAIVGIDPGSSFVRFGNFRDDGLAVRNDVEVYSVSEKRTLGRFDVTVPAKGAAQISFADVVSRAGLDLTEVSKHELAFYVQNGRSKQVYQHVQYDARTQSLVNASACSYAPAVDYVPPSNIAMNVHTSIIQHIPSHVTIHNFADTDRHLDVRVTDARTGELIGVVPISLAPRSSFNETAVWFEQQLGWRPARNQPHINIEATLIEGNTANPNVLVAHSVFNNRNGAQANLSTVCPIHGGIITLDDPVAASAKP